MSSLADLPELVGFFSYARSDDENSDMALSLLRKRIRSELRLQLGRELRLWQDTEAIPHGALWQGEIKKAIAESAFFIPIVTPSAVNSPYCRTEFEAFVARESELLRNDLVFPILYIRVPALANADQRSRDNVLKIIHLRQYADWTKIRLDDVASSEVAKQIAHFCEDIVEALHKPWEPREERRSRGEVEAVRLAEEERRLKEDIEARERELRERVRRAWEGDAQRQNEAARSRRDDADAGYGGACAQTQRGGAHINDGEGKPRSCFTQGMAALAPCIGSWRCAWRCPHRFSSRLVCNSVETNSDHQNDTCPARASSHYLACDNRSVRVRPAIP
jgi:hypothetical protein